MTTLQQIPAGHVHIAGALCPYCDQPIPNNRVREITEQFEARTHHYGQRMRSYN